MSTPDSPRDRAIHRLLLKHALRQQLYASILIFGLMTLVWFWSGRGYFWPAWIAFGLSFSLLSKLFKVYHRSPVISEEAIARELRQR